MEGKSCDSAISDTRDSNSDHIIDMELSYTYQECGGSITLSLLHTWEILNLSLFQKFVKIMKTAHFGRCTMENIVIF